MSTEKHKVDTKSRMFTAEDMLDAYIRGNRQTKFVATTAAWVGWKSFLEEKMAEIFETKLSWHDFEKFSDRDDFAKSLAKKVVKNW